MAKVAVGVAASHPHTCSLLQRVHVCSHRHRQGKAKSLVIKLLSSAGTGFFYTTTKNPRRVTRKLALMKVRAAACAVCGFALWVAACVCGVGD